MLYVLYVYGTIYRANTCKSNVLARFGTPPILVPARDCAPTTLPFDQRQERERSQRTVRWPHSTVESGRAAVDTATRNILSCASSGITRCWPAFPAREKLLSVSGAA